MSDTATIRVFPRRTKATPDDRLAFVGEPPLFLPNWYGQVLVSCAFTWDRPEAERLAKEWQFRYPEATVRVGGPACDDPGGEFEPGRFLKIGYTITSRGCPNRCKRCFVPQREGKLRLLPIRDGWDVLDNNLLACPEDHIRAVCDILKRQPQKPRFTGGLEAARLTRPLAECILETKPDRLFFAYDRPGELKSLREAARLLERITAWSPGHMRHVVSCYVLVGFEGDTVALAEARVAEVMSLNMRAYPMFYRDEQYTRRSPEWHDLIGGVLAMGGAR